MTSRQQHGRDQGRTPLVELTTTDPVKTGDVWGITAIAVVHQGQTPWNNRLVKFHLNGNEAGEMSTDSNGRAAGIINGLVPGSYVVEAQVDGTAIRNKVRVVIAPEATPLVPVVLGLQRTKTKETDAEITYALTACGWSGADGQLNTGVQLRVVKSEERVEETYSRGDTEREEDITLSVNVKGREYKANIRVLIPAKPKKVEPSPTAKPATLSFTKSKTASGAILTFQVFDAEGKGVKGRVVRITGPVTQKDSNPTNDSGVATIEVALLPGLLKESFNCSIMGTSITCFTSIYA